MGLFYYLPEALHRSKCSNRRLWGVDLSLEDDQDIPTTIVLNKIIEYAWFSPQPEWMLDMVLGWQAKVSSLGVANKTFPSQFRGLAYVTTHRVVDPRDGNNRSEVVVLWTRWGRMGDAMFEDQNL